MSYLQVGALILIAAPSHLDSTPCQLSFSLLSMSCQQQWPLSSHHQRDHQLDLPTLIQATLYQPGFWHLPTRQALYYLR